jgi:hypothetical protein
MYLGDYITGAIIAGFFNTRAADGTPLALAGSPALAVYAAGNTSESTAGVVLATNFDSRTGLHHFNVDTNADSNFYSGGSEYVVVLTSGTIGGISAVGRIVAEFSITNRSDSLISQLIYILGDPEFGLLVQILGRLPEALVDGRIDASVGAIADNAITNAAIAASAVTEIQSGLATSSSLSNATALIEDIAGVVDAILQDTESTGVVVASASKSGYSLTPTTGLGNQTANLTGSVSSVTNAVTVGTINANAVSASALATDAVEEIQAGLSTASQVSALNNLSTAQVLAQCTAALETAISELSAVPSATPTTKQALMFLYMALRNQSTTTASSQTIRNDAGTTIATATLADDGTTMTKGEFA